MSLQRIDISNLPSGIYYVRLGNWTRKFVKVE
ncbi:MAG: T9SS type A sorting domain-containing protein [Candidatus Kapabacteria bacterium]|nr:T9SS type A sorting domain-containing protein [Candidatus Kapabacteria bacterium]